MVRLLHLNGPSRVGKSTLARRYAAAHPGVLNLDIDVLVGLVGGWQDDFDGALLVAKADGTALALRHLSSGRDVVLPQLVTSFDTVALGETIAEEAGAEYIEIVLLADADAHRARLAAKVPEHDVEAYIQAALTADDDDLLQRIQHDLERYLADRPLATRIDTTELTLDETYDRILERLR